MASPTRRDFLKLTGSAAALGLLPSTIRAALSTPAAYVTGTVKDDSGGVLPGADVVATQTDTGFKRAAVTDTNGLYTLSNLPIGPYRLDVTLSGFRSFARTGIVLQVNANPVIDVTMAIGNVAETVSVEAATPLVETRSPAIGAVIENERIEELASLRALLEPELASRALPRAHAALIDRMAAINGVIDEMIVKGDASGYVRSNLEFHRTLYLRAQAPAMLALIETVWLQAGPTMRMLYERLQRRQASDNHRKIIAALRAGDGAAASGEGGLALRAEKPSEVLLFDLA